MSDSVTTSVEVAVSRDVAFDAFAREIDAWYRVDPDTLPDMTRTAAIRFESHVGGRLLDVHDLESGAGRELGRVTAWEPGRRLAFKDNEGTEVEVSFEPSGAGTRVTLTHRGLDRLPPNRAAEPLRSGWPALADLYRGHLAPKARPIALAVGPLALSLAIGAAGLLLAARLSSGQPPVWVVLAVLLGASFAVGRIEDRLWRRWRPSRWQCRRNQRRVFALAALGILIWGLYRAVQHGEDLLSAIGVPALILMSWSLGEYGGPAGGRSLRKRAEPTQRTFGQRHPDAWLFFLLVGVIALTLGVFSGLSSIDARLADGLFVAILTVLAAVELHAIASKRRERRALGFNPDFYLAVERRVGEQDRPPELLVRHHSKQPEYSGWYAYADEQDESSRDLVAWSMRDLVDHSPEAAHPLRKGRGKWRWDQRQHAYRPIGHVSEDPQTA